jgi:hypothetical protein
VFERDKFEIHSLDRWPDHPIGFETGKVALRQLLLGVATLHDRHTREEECHIASRKHRLIGQHSRRNRHIVVLELDSILQEAIPLGGSWSKHACDGQRYSSYVSIIHTASIESHAPCPSDLMLLEAFLLNHLLSQNIPSTK